jgi:hypothetical protein
MSYKPSPIGHFPLTIIHEPLPITVDSLTEAIARTTD